jgi:hypothetical protein
VADLLAASPYNQENLVGSFDDRKTLEELKRKLDEDEKEVAWLWMGKISMTLWLLLAHRTT